MNDRIDNLKDCELLKRQFAFELFCRTHGRNASLEAQYEAAQAIARELYPHDATPNASLYIASTWTKDPIVIDTFLQLENGVAEGALLPNERQAALLLASILDDIDSELAALSCRARKRKRIAALRRTFLEGAVMFTELIGREAQR